MLNNQLNNQAAQDFQFGLVASATSHPKKLEKNTTKVSLNLQKQVERSILLTIAKVAPDLARALTWHRFIHPKRSKSYTLQDLPANAQALTLEHSKQVLKGYRWNQNSAESAKRIYMVHSWDGNVTKLKHFVQPLVTQGYEVITFDMPAHGKSLFYTKQKTTNFQDWISALETIVRTYGPAHSMIAYSYGAAVTINMLSKNPDLIPKKLSLIAPMLSAHTRIKVFSKKAMLPEYLSESIQEMLIQNTNLNLNNTNLATLSKKLFSTGFSCDGLICHDHNDTQVPYDYGQAIAAAWNGAQLYSSRKLGHHNILRNSVVIDKIVEHSVK